MNDLQKAAAATLYQTGDFSTRDVAALLQIPKSTAADFLHSTHPTHKDWWENWKGKNLLLNEIPVKNVVGSSSPKILVFDIETAPMKGWFWTIWQADIPLDRIERDWYVLSWSAKWLGSDDVLYEDKRGSWDTCDDKHLLQGIWRLLDEADIVVTQNGKKFDVKKLNTRFVLNGMKPPRSYKHIDTCEQAKRVFGFTSNKLEYLSDKLCRRHKKLKHKNYPGNSLWDACLVGDMEAWEEMEEYNVHDVLSLEEVYLATRMWMKGHPNISLYHGTDTCVCGSTSFEHSGYHYTGTSKFKKFQCTECGYEMRDSVNLVTTRLRNIV